MMFLEVKSELMSSTLLPVLILTQVSASVLSTVPDLPQKCSLSDSACLKTVAQQVLPHLVVGMHELGIEPLDVMHIHKTKVDVAGLKLTVSDAYIKGLKNTVMKNITFDMVKKILTIIYEVADINVQSKYKASGQLLVLPISGDGDMSIDLKKLYIEMTMSFDIVKNKNGTDILVLKSYKFQYDVKDGAHFNLTNLFNGNKGLSTTLITFMNENWKTLSVEFGRPMLENVQKKTFDRIKTYFQSQPLDYFVEE